MTFFFQFFQLFHLRKKQLWCLCSILKEFNNSRNIFQNVGALFRLRLEHLPPPLLVCERHTISKGEEGYKGFWKRGFIQKFAFAHVSSFKALGYGFREPTFPGWSSKRNKDFFGAKMRSLPPFMLPLCRQIKWRRISFDFMLLTIFWMKPNERKKL